MEYSKDDLLEAKRQIDSTLHKLRETIKTLQAKEKPERCKSQITLAERRVRAFELAKFLLAGCYQVSPMLQNPHDLCRAPQANPCFASVPFSIEHRQAII